VTRIIRQTASRGTAKRDADVHGGPENSRSRYWSMSLLDYFVCAKDQQSRNRQT